MAETDKKNKSNVLISHFRRKPDESCSTVVKIEGIVDKLKFYRPDEFMESEQLEHGNIKIKLKIYPNVEDENDGEACIKMMVFIDNPEKRKWMKGEFHIAQNSAGEFLDIAEFFPKNIKKKNHCEFQVSYSISHSMVLAENAAYLPDGVLTVKAILYICGEETVIHTSSKLPEKSITPNQLKGKLTGDLKNMMESENFSDFRIICQGEAIPCHRNILSARSEIFEAMLVHNMKESETGEVEINDFDPKTMKAAVLYMYTGEVKYSKENAEQLMKAADKYRLEELKNAIEDALIEDVKIENAIDMFILGDAVHADKLRDTSKTIIVSNAVAIMKMDGWKEALGRFQDLTFEILESLANSKAVA